MTIDDLKGYLDSVNVRFEETRLQWGNQVRCASGENFTLYDSGKLVPGGKKSELTDQVVALHGKRGDLRILRLCPLKQKWFQNPAKMSLLCTVGTRRRGMDLSSS